MNREEISGQRLWEGSLLLCEHMLQASQLGSGDSCNRNGKSADLDFHKKTMLELGAGTGVVSMLAHGLGAATVAVTDGDDRCDP